MKTKSLIKYYFNKIHHRAAIKNLPINYSMMVCNRTIEQSAKFKNTYCKPISRLL